LLLRLGHASVGEGLLRARARGRARGRVRARVRVEPSFTWARCSVGDMQLRC